MREKCEDVIKASLIGQVNHSSIYHWGPGYWAYFCLGRRWTGTSPSGAPGRVFFKPYKEEKK